MSKISTASFQELMKYTNQANDKAVISVGIIKDGQASYTIYGENGKELPKELHTYEIGSITKTITAAMVNKAIKEGKLDINTTIDHYLVLPKGNTYPTIKQLLTHTAGYRSYYIEIPMIFNFLRGRNGFYGVKKDRIISKIKKHSGKNRFKYSNYGFAVLGLVLEGVYQSEYTPLVNAFLQQELTLKNTKISNQKGDLKKYWDWKNGDAYLAAGGVTSNISDMLSYAQLQLDEYKYVGECHKCIKTINATPPMYNQMGIHIDQIGMSWIIDQENEIIWHSGGTGHYNSYIGFNSKKGIAVVILSNLAPNYRIPATVLGVKLYQELVADCATVS